MALDDVRSAALDDVHAMALADVRSAALADVRSAALDDVHAMALANVRRPALDDVHAMALANVRRPALDDVQAMALGGTRGPFLLTRACVRVARMAAPRLEPYLIALGLLTLAACQTAAPPPNAEYPSLVLPARSEPTAPSPRPAGAAGAGAQSPDSSLARESPAGSSRVPLVRSPHGDLPDPPPLSERAQWSYPVSYDRGTIRVGEPQLVCLPRPQATPRRIGRFAFELWLGHELVERLRFDFPLLASEEPPEGPRRQLREPPRFAPGARVSVTLRVPASERAATARILDRATGETIEVSWPPPSAADAALACRKQGPQSKPSASSREPSRPTGAGR